MVCRKQESCRWCAGRAVLRSFPCFLSRKTPDQSSGKLAYQAAGVGIYAWPGSGTDVQRGEPGDMAVLSGLWTADALLHVQVWGHAFNHMSGMARRFYNDQSSKWEKAPEPEKLPEPEKGETTEKETNVDKAVQLKRRSETETDEPKAKKGGIASATDKVKSIELKPASEVSKASREKCVEGAGKAGESTAEKSEKKTHTPRSGIVLKTAEEVQQQDAGEKAPHGDSSDDADDVVLAENLQKASSVAWTSRKGMEGSDGPRSDEVLYGDEDTRTLETSSKVTISGVDEDPYAPSQVSVLSSRKRQERDVERRRSHVSPRRQRRLGEGVVVHHKVYLPGKRLWVRRMKGLTPSSLRT